MYTNSIISIHREFYRLDDKRKAVALSRNRRSPIVVTALAAVALILFCLSDISTAEPYYFHGKIKNTNKGFPYPIKGFRCKINIDKDYSEDRYLAYPLEADPDSAWMCSLKDDTHISVWVDRKKKKNGEWSNKGKVISMEVE